MKHHVVAYTICLTAVRQLKTAYRKVAQVVRQFRFRPDKKLSCLPDKKIFFIFYAVFWVFSGCLHADIKKDMEDFYNSFGVSSNVNSADVYQGQKAGYATGGSVSVRNPILRSNIATVNLPRIDAGCGGIDIYAGGLSFINSERLKENLKSIAASSGSYAFFLGVESFSPLIANQMKTLQGWSNTINGMSINSCETAAQLVGSVWPKSEMASHHICKTMGTQKGAFKSYVETKHQCATAAGLQESREAARLAHPNLLFGSYNLAWKAIQQQELLAGRTDLAQLLMTITGTIIVKDIDGKQSYQIFPSHMTNESFLKVLLEGGKCKMYKCDNDKQCLTITESPLDIAQESSVMGRVRKALIGIQEKIVADEEISPEELKILAMSGLPLYKIINVLTAYKHGSCPLDLVDIADVVAMDMLMQCIQEGIENIRAGAIKLRAEQMYADTIDAYISDLDRVMKEIRHHETRALNRLEQQLAILEKIQVLEKKLAIEFGL